jgi:hypothetical protein
MYYIQTGFYPNYIKYPERFNKENEAVNFAFNVLKLNTFETIKETEAKEILNNLKQTYERTK